MSEINTCYISKNVFRNQFCDPYVAKNLKKNVFAGRPIGITGFPIGLNGFSIGLFGFPIGLTGFLAISTFQVQFPHSKDESSNMPKYSYQSQKSKITVPLNVRESVTLQIFYQLQIQIQKARQNNNRRKILYRRAITLQCMLPATSLSFQ